MPRLFHAFSSRRLPRLAAFALLALVATGVGAQNADDVDVADPPERVARIALLEGPVAFLPAGAGDWTDASLNWPLSAGDQLATAHAAHAVVELGGSSLALDADSDLTIGTLDATAARLEARRGALALEVRALAAGDSIEIDTPALAFVADRPGRFRLDIAADGTTRVSVLASRARAYGPDAAERELASGASYTFRTADFAHADSATLPPPDAFDVWVERGPLRQVTTTTTRYVSEEVVGYADLDRYGDWETAPDYGPVWYPAGVASGWAPYRDGRWAWIAPWGWTWIDAAPWGFAPYHYGRWALIGARWAWVPGPFSVRPVYAPALVAFVGGGSWAIGAGSTPVGWFPLGPGEFYRPWYHAGRGYYTRLNLGGISARHRLPERERVDRIHRDWDQWRAKRPPHYPRPGTPHGFTAMPGQAFAQGRGVHGHRLDIDQRRLMNAPLLARGPADLTPKPTRRPGTTPARRLPTGDFARRVHLDRPVNRVPVRTASPSTRPTPRQPEAPSTRPTPPRTTAPRPRSTPAPLPRRIAPNNAAPNPRPMPATPRPTQRPFQPPAPRQAEPPRAALPAHPARLPAATPRTPPPRGWPNAGQAPQRPAAATFPHTPPPVRTAQPPRALPTPRRVQPGSPPVRTTPAPARRAESAPARAPRQRQVER